MLCAAIGVNAQNPDRSLLELLGAQDTTAASTRLTPPPTVYIIDEDSEDDDDEDDEAIDGFGLLADTVAADTFQPLPFLPVSTLPKIAFLPTVFDGFQHLDSVPLADPAPYLVEGGEGMTWLRVLANQGRQYRQLKQTYMLYNMPSVRYNINTMPKPPAKYEATVDPQKATITITEIKSDKSSVAAEAQGVKYGRRNWLHNINAMLQFSQAYISPNWYQGGNNSINGIGSFRWNVKLNNKFHPNYIFEATTQYKLGLSNAPQDECHDYLITEDQFQFNATAGIHAFRRWFYSMNMMFKTQLFESYPSNSKQLRAAFMSPGELNFGLGMTYNYVNPKNTVRLDVSISPLSYNLKVSTHPGIPVTSFGIREGHHTNSEYGSNAEVRFSWNIMWNISYNSRLFVFTDYDYAMADWENTLNFSVNRYFSTQLFFHTRFDTSRGRMPDSTWHRWQLKEILSFGLQYQFKTI